MICSKCQHQNNPDFSFCMQCGTPLKIDCPDCGHANAADFKFCMQCGHALAPAMGAYALTGNDIPASEDLNHQPDAVPPEPQLEPPPTPGPSKADVPASEDLEPELAVAPAQPNPEPIHLPVPVAAAPALAPQPQVIVIPEEQKSRRGIPGVVWLLGGILLSMLACVLLVWLNVLDVPAGVVAAVPAPVAEVIETIDSQVSGPPLIALPGSSDSGVSQTESGSRQTNTNHGGSATTRGSNTSGDAADQTDQCNDFSNAEIVLKVNDGGYVEIEIWDDGLQEPDYNRDHHLQVIRDGMVIPIDIKCQLFVTHGMGCGHNLDSDAALKVSDFAQYGFDIAKARSIDVQIWDTWNENCPASYVTDSIEPVSDNQTAGDAGQDDQCPGFSGASVSGHFNPDGSLSVGIISILESFEDLGYHIQIRQPGQFTPIDIDCDYENWVQLICENHSGDGKPIFAADIANYGIDVTQPQNFDVTVWPHNGCPEIALDNELVINPVEQNQAAGNDDCPLNDGNLTVNFVNAKQGDAYAYIKTDTEFDDINVFEIYSILNLPTGSFQVECNQEASDFLICGPYDVGGHRDTHQMAEVLLKKYDNNTCSKSVTTTLPASKAPADNKTNDGEGCPAGQSMCGGSCCSDGHCCDGKCLEYCP